MNLSDLNNKYSKLISELNDSGIEEIIKSYKNIIKNLALSNNKKIVYLWTTTIVGGDTQACNNAREIQHDNKIAYISLVDGLRQINYNNVLVKLMKLKQEYDLRELNVFFEHFMNDLDKIHAITALKANDKIDITILNETIDSINDIISAYENLKMQCEQVVNIHNRLQLEYKPENVKIRLLSEDNSVKKLVNNFILLDSIYNNINTIAGEESEPLKYSRIESGCIEVTLSGIATSLAAVVSLLTLTYKVYSERFSPSAKLEMELKKAELESKNIDNNFKKLKLRGEIIKTISDNNKKEINYSDSKIGSMLCSLEEDLKKFCASNPCINVNEKEIGMPALKDKEIPLQLLDSKEDLEDMGEK